VVVLVSLISIIVVSGSIVALVFREMQERQKRAKN
jgi:Na+-transporting NADH:ubiquinone oxidoreductase subunit NqrC